MTNEIKTDEIFDLVDIREIPDDQLDDLMGGGLAPVSPQLKFA